MLVSFGGATVGETSRDLFLTEAELDLGGLRTGDEAWPIRHGSRPGVDYLEAGTFTFGLVTSPHIRDGVAASDAVSVFARAWRSGLRAGAGVMLPLRVDVDGRSRVLYGRPGRLDTPVPGSSYMRQGVGEILAEFRVLDPFVYAAESSDVSVSVVPRSLGGIVAPVTTPITTSMTSGVSYRFIDVEGDADAAFAVTFHGPARNPSLTVDGVEVGIVGDIAYDEDVTVNGRDRSVTLADGSPVAARLSRGTRIDRMRLSPGLHEVSFTAEDRTGTAAATVSVTPAYFHL